MSLEWAYGRPCPASREAKRFDEAMADFTAVATAAILASYDFSSIGTLVDVGGGDGGLIAAILKTHPQMKGVLFDAPHVVAGVQRRMKTEGLTKRCEISAGDFFARCRVVETPTYSRTSSLIGTRSAAWGFCGTAIGR